MGIYFLGADYADFTDLFFAINNAMKIFIRILFINLIREIRVIRA